MYIKTQISSVPKENTRFSKFKIVYSMQNLNSTLQTQCNYSKFQDFIQHKKKFTQNFTSNHMPKTYIPISQTFNVLPKHN